MFRLRILLRPLKRGLGLSWESWGMPCNLHHALQTSRWIEIARIFLQLLSGEALVPARGR